MSLKRDILATIDTLRADVEALFDAVPVVKPPVVESPAQPSEPVPALPDPPPSSRAEPAGLATIFDGEPVDLTKRDDGNWRVVQDRTAPTSPPAVLRARYPKGMRGGGGPVAWYPPGFRVSTLYFGMWFKMSENFRSHSTGINKLVHFYSCGINNVFLEARGHGLVPSFGFQRIARAYDPSDPRSTAGHLMPNQGVEAAFGRGRWHRVEVLLTANTGGRANGTATLWLDERRVVSSTGLGWCDGDGQWEGVNINPTWGGAGDTVGEEFWFDVDHVRITGK
jgi:hypothetical protein